MKASLSIGLALSSLFLLSACDPAHQTTSDLCSAGENVAVRATYPNFEVELNNADKPIGEYKFFLNDIARGLTPVAGSSLSSEEEEARTNILNFINKYMHYTINPSDGTVTKAENPIDFVSWLIASTDPDIVIDAFQQALQQISFGIQKDDGVCNYNNSNILLIKEDATPDDGKDDTVRYKGTLNLTYTPFRRDFVQQSIIFNQEDVSAADPTRRLLTPYTGFFQADASDFKSAGYTPPKIRQAIINDLKGVESLKIDDGPILQNDGSDRNLGQVFIETLNTYCEEKSFAVRDPSRINANLDRDRDGRIDGDTNGDNILDSSDYKTCSVVYADSPDPYSVRPPAKEQCTGGTDSTTGLPQVNEVDKVQYREINLSSTNDALRGLKRIRVEVDYDRNETRVYGSKYREATYDSDGTTVIHDPTRCEQIAILKELRETGPSPDPTAKLTIIQDPNFDILKDEEGNDIEPTPLFTFTGQPRVE